MKKILLVSLVFASLFVSNLMAKDAVWDVVEFTASSSSIRAGTVMKMWLSSGSAGSDNYAILVASPVGIIGSSNHLDFTRGQVKSPAVSFSTAMVSAGVADSNITMIDYSPYGVYCASATTVWKSAASSGFANRVYLLWTPGLP